MEKTFVAKTWNFFAYLIVVTGVVFTFSDIFLWVQQAEWRDIIKASLLEGLVILTLLIVLFIKISEKIVLTEHGITQLYNAMPQFYKGISLLFKADRRSVEWKDITKIEGEFGIFHIGERITLYLARDKFSTYDVIQERDRMTITNDLSNFENLVVEVVTRATGATVAENVKKIVSRYKNADS